MDRAVIDVLERASSQDPNILKPAEQALKEWETQPGFYTALFNVFSNTSFSINVRWMAILYLKNGVDRYWRKNAPGEIDLNEKEYIRQGLISKFNEPVNQLAIQLAVLIAKIARYDCPKNWESLVPTLLEVIRSEDSLIQHRALLTFHQVVKTLASKRLSADRRIFQDLTMNVFNYVFGLWNNYTESFLVLTSNGTDQQILESLEKALLLLKMLRKLSVHGMIKPSQDENAMLFLKLIFERIKTCLECRKTLLSRNIRVESCEKFIIHMKKVLLEMVEYHPYCFIEYIPASLELAVFYCFTQDGQNLVFERFIIQCLNLMKKILQANKYKLAKMMEESDYPFAVRASQLKQEFFTQQILTEICTRLVTHYFVLNQSDLECWDSDPESFGVDDCGESWKYNLRPCTESVFLTILHQFKDVLSNVLVELVQRHHQPVDPNDLHGILMKDAVYNAVGLAGFDLFDEINFDQWFSTSLKEELKDKSSNNRIIRRRVCWLIGRWTGVKLSQELRPDLYDLMVQSLHPSEDLGVRLAASDALKLAIDDFQFNTNDFAPFLKPAFSLLFSLLKTVNQCDSKMRVLFVLSFMIERVGCGIKPHIEAFYAYLPDLWQQSEQHNMLRCAIVSTLVHLVKALGADSVILQQPLVVGVVELSCDLNQDDHVYLLDDGLDLWLALVENSPLSNPAIMNLFKNMPELLETSSENLRVCLYIIKAYLLLNPQEFITRQGLSIVESLRSMLTDLGSEGIIMVMRTLELSLKVDPGNGVQFIKPFLVGIFENIYRGDSHPMLLTMYLSIAARVLLISRDVFNEVVRELVARIGPITKEEMVFAQIMVVYMGHMPLITQQKRRKLLALALSSIIDTNCPSAVLQYFPKMIVSVVETLNDITEVNDQGVTVDSMMLDDQNDQLEDIGYETEHLQRKRRLAFTDPVHCIALEELLQNQLNLLKRSIGEEQFNHMIQSLGLEVNQQLREYVTI